MGGNPTCSLYHIISVSLLLSTCGSFSKSVLWYCHPTSSGRLGFYVPHLYWRRGYYAMLWSIHPSVPCPSSTMVILGLLQNTNRKPHAESWTYWSVHTNWQWPKWLHCHFDKAVTGATLEAFTRWLHHRYSLSNCHWNGDISFHHAIPC